MKALLFRSVLTLGLMAGCQRQEPPRTDPAADAAGWARDSAKNYPALVKWLRDSVVRDSVSRMINTDSLYRLHLVEAHAANPIPIVGKALCEQARLSFVYGSLPAEAAVKRMEDTLTRVVDKKDRERIDARLGHLSVDEQMSLGIGRAKCGDWGPVGPTSINGTELDEATGRPLRPKPPVVELHDSSPLAVVGLS